MPGTPRLGNFEDLPQIEYPIVKKGSQTSTVLNLYVLVHFLFLFMVFFEFLNDFKAYPGVALSFFIFTMMYSLTCFGKFFDKK
jgi:hypothetical protein